MNQAGVVARLAVRELWISFRILLVLVAFVGAGVVVALMPAPLPTTLQRLAFGLGAATIVTAAAAAWSMAEERRTGRAGWLVNRSLSRGTLLGGWFGAIAGLACVALACAATLGWLAASSVSVGLEPGGYASLVLAIAASAIAATALGLLAGIVAPTRAAAVAATALCLVAGAAAWSAPVDSSLLPGGAYVSLATLVEPGGDIASGLRAGGVALATAALLLAAARVALDRAEL